MTISNAAIFGPTFVPGKVGDNQPVVYFDDFTDAFTVLEATPAITQDPSAKFCDVPDRGDYLVSGGGSTTVWPTMADEVGGVVTMTTGPTASNRICCQLNGEMFSLANGRELYFEIRAKFATSADFHAGVVVADVNATVITDGVTIDTTGTSTVQTRVEKNSGGALANTAATIESDVYSVFAFKCRADKKVEYYVNGIRIAMIDDPANFPDDELLSPLFQIGVTSGGSGAEALNVDYILCVGER